MESELSAALSKYQRRPQDSDDLVLQVVEVEPGRARLEVLEADAVVAERELSPLSGSCQEQTEALALAASIAIDALSRERKALAATPTAPPAPPARADPPRPAPAPGKVAERPWSFYAGTGAGLQAIGLSLRLDGGLVWQPLPPLLLSGRLLAELGPARDVGSGAASWQRFGGSAGAGVRLVTSAVLRLDLLLEGVIVLQVVRGQRFESPLTEQRAELAVSSSLRLAPAWRLRPYIEPGLTFWAREQLASAVDPDETLAIGRVAFRLLLGVACCGR